MSGSTEQREKITSLGTIYCLTSPSGKRYVGQTRQTLKQRMAAHRAQDNSKRGCRALGNAAAKYKWDNMKVKILWEGPVDQLDAREAHFIETYQTLAPKGYNLMTGGGSCGTHSEETRGKISLSMKKQYASGRRTHPFKGKTLSDTHKKNLSIAMKKRKNTWNPKGSKRTKRSKHVRMKISNTLKKNKRLKISKSRPRTGCIRLSQRIVSDGWVHIAYRVNGPYPIMKALGYHSSRVSSDAALAKYKEAHPEEVD